MPSYLLRGDHCQNHTTSAENKNEETDTNHCEKKKQNQYTDQIEWDYIACMWLEAARHIYL